MHCSVAICSSKFFQLYYVEIEFSYESMWCDGQSSRCAELQYLLSAFTVLNCSRAVAMITLWPLVLCYGVSLTWTVATSEPRALQQSRAEDRTGDETRRDESVGGSWRDESSPNRWSPFGSEAVQGVLARPFRVASLAALSLAFLSALRWPPLINDAMPWLMALLKRFMR